MTAKILPFKPRCAEQVLDEMNGIIGVDFVEVDLPAVNQWYDRPLLCDYSEEKVKPIDNGLANFYLTYEDNFNFNYWF